MAADQQAPVRRPSPLDWIPIAGNEPTYPSRQTPLSRLAGGGIVGNERLTAANGIALLVLLAALGVTILRIRQLTSIHLFLGLLLIPPVALKMASTGYRFARYYTHHPVYRQRGAPPAALRLLGPLVVGSTVTVFATGVALLAVGPGSTGPLRLLHKASFIVWVGATAIHVLGHLPDLPRAFMVRREGRVEYNAYAAGSAGRAIALTSALVAGLVLAIVLIPHFNAWVNAEHLIHDH